MIVNVAGGYATLASHKTHQQASAVMAEAITHDDSNSMYHWVLHSVFSDSQVLQLKLPFRV